MNENLAKARAAARADQPAPLWRLIITDSESPSGLAPVCSGERSDALHMIDDYPGGPQRDEDGVYDCCPYPQIETYSTVWAEYLIELLNADAGLRAAVNLLTRATGETGSVPGCRAAVFADVDRLLEAQRRQHAGRHIFSDGIEHARQAVAELAGAPAEKATATAPTATPFFQVGHTYSREHHGRSIEFLIDCISTPPDGSWRIARGWRRTEDCDWEPMDSDDFTGWTDVAEGGGCRG